MSVFRALELKWGGKVVEWTPSLSVLRRMDAALKADGRTSDVTQLATACMNGGVNLPDLAICWSIALRSAGHDVHEDDCYDVLMKAEDMQAILNFQARLYEAVFPHIDLGKNLAAPSQGKPMAAGRRKAAMTGQAST
jgi:hypothetical protein